MDGNRLVFCVSFYEINYTCDQASYV